MNVGISWILIIFFLSWKREQSIVVACNIRDGNAEENQKKFKEYVSKEAVHFIYVNISSSSFMNLTLDQTEWSKITEWIWVTQGYEYFLSYPVEIDVLTFGLMRQNVRTLEIDVKIGNLSDCVRKTLWKQIYIYLFTEYNATGSYFCHGYFENHTRKAYLSFISHASIGYGFHCFQKNDTSFPLAVEKSYVIYFTIAIILILFFYYPVLLLNCLHATKTDRQLSSYTKAEYPFTLPRLLHYTIFYTKTSNNTERLTGLKRIFKICFIGTRLSILITLVTGTVWVIMYVFEKNCNGCLPPNANLIMDFELINDIYTEEDFAFIIILTFFSFLFLVVFNSHLLMSDMFEDHFVLVDFSTRLFRSIHVSRFFRKEQISVSKILQTVNRFYLILSPQFWCKIYLLPLTDLGNSKFRSLMKLLISPLNFMVNFILVIIFSFLPMVNTIYLLLFLPFKLKLKTIKPRTALRVFIAFIQIFALILAFLSTALLLSPGNILYKGMSCSVQFFVYSILVAVPNFNSDEFYIFLIFSAGVIYMSKFYLQFCQFYQLMLEKVIELRGTKSLPIHYFDVIVKHSCPVRTQLFFLFAKVLITFFLLNILYFIFKDIRFVDSQYSFDLNRLITCVFILLTPGFLEVFFLDDNANKIQRMHQDLDEQLRNLDSIDVLDTDNNEQPGHSQHTNINQDSCPEQTTSWCKLLLLCFCGCVGSPHNENGQWICCFTLEEEFNGKEAVYEPKYCNIFDICHNFQNREDYDNLDELSS